MSQPTVCIYYKYKNIKKYLLLKTQLYIKCYLKDMKKIQIMASVLLKNFNNNFNKEVKKFRRKLKGILVIFSNYKQPI
jgi:hypothetical protein